MTELASQSYQHATEPRAVHRRKKYREPLAQQQNDYPRNIMFDRRVVRGSTYAQPITGPDQMQENTKPKRTNKPPAESQRATTPKAVEGRKHIDVQTESYLEELSDAVRTAVADTQTDPFLDRPPTPLFVPHKVGVDAETQIYEGDLFDFDLEVEPMLDIITGKTLEQSMMEVLEEEELANLRHHQDEFDRIRNAELAETQRMEAAEKRRFEEKQRRLKQEQDRLEKETQVQNKVAARTFAKSYVGDLVQGIFSDLSSTGYFFDPLQKEIDDDFIPWLINETCARVADKRVHRKMVDDLIRLAVSKRAERRGAVKEERRAAAEKIRLEEEEKIRKAEEEQRLKENAEAAAKEQEQGDETQEPSEEKPEEN